ncbi:molybdenum transport system permease protein ModB [Sulfurospirillum multivorans DSM 12446]|uniref:Molybdenum transport system permease n=3 Tax=Sulfurospirillum multivorans TaxID=66821 RepID=A0AA86APZ4_SULMK|nr:molybdenum transport system permease protein ModB [Sulfurospirillum multivorans DSM 12446]QEH07147.1 molybdenum transport system permease protein ModB [Sulfurospirillum multivorans]
MGYEMVQVWHPLVLSLKTIGVVALLLVFLGIPLSYYLSKEELKYKWLLETLVTLPLIFPPIAIGFLLLLLLGKQGWIGSYFNAMGIRFIFEFKGLVIAGFVAALPLMVKPLQSAIELFPKTIKEAAYMGGRSRFYTFIFIILPCIKKSVVAALLIALARALGEVGITLMLGGNLIGKTDTISLAIYNAVFDGEYRLALLLCAILIVISLAVFTALHFFQKEEQFL